MLTVARSAKRLMFGKYLLLTNTASCGVLMGLGDLTVQSIDRMYDGSGKKKSIDWHRTGRMFTIGVVFGPIFHVWYKYLDRFLPATNTKTVIKKICIDQTSSPFCIYIFFMGMGLMEGKGKSASYKEFKRNFWPVYKADWAFWPPVQSINFFFLPSQARVIYVAFATLCWDTFLSYMKHKEHKPHAHIEKSECMKPANIQLGPLQPQE